MKKLFLFLGLFFFSCHKEDSCQGCINGNKPPVANAGVDQIITFPISTVTINGSGSTDPDNNIISHLWTKISGPSSFNISNQGTVQTQITSLVQGVYQFELKVTDADGLSAADTIKISVILPANEVIVNDLTWKYWHDPNDPNSAFDEVYLYIPDTMNILANSSLNIFVKLDSSSGWVPVNPVLNGNCSPPYTYFILPVTAANTLVLLIEDCSLNHNLIGTGASIKIDY